MSAIVDDRKWRKFFEVYRGLPEIWEVKNEAYKNRDKRNVGWQKLLECYQTIDRHATLEKLKHRVNNIRTCYRRELRKIYLSEKLGPDGVHVPTLWYFNLLDFIRDQEIKTRDTRWRDNPFLLDDIEDIPLSDTEFDDPKPQSLKRCKVKKRKMTPIKHLHNDDDDDVVDDIVDVDDDDDERPEKRAAYDKSKDEASIYADGWACSYRKLTVEQQLYAKKAIEEVLILGQLNALNLETVDASTPLRSKARPGEFEEIYDEQIYEEMHE